MLNPLAEGFENAMSTTITSQLQTGELQLQSIGAQLNELEQQFNAEFDNQGPPQSGASGGGSGTGGASGSFDWSKMGPGHVLGGLWAIGTQGPPQAGASGSVGTSGTSGSAGVSGTSGVNPSDELSKDDKDKLLAGDYYSSQPQKSKATCPPDVSMDELMDASGGLLKNMGNQQLTGKGAEGISGGIKDNLARLAGGKPGDIGTNKDVTMRALMIAESTKNMKGSDGNMLDADTRHNGNLSGLNPSGEADNGSELGYMQNMFKDPNYSLPDVRGTSDHMNADDTEKSGGQLFMQDVGKYLFPLLAAPLMLLAPELAVPEVIGAEVGTDVGVAGAEVGEAGADAGESAATAAGSAGRSAAGAGSGSTSAGSSSVGDYMAQLAAQTAKQAAKEGLKEGGKEGWNQIQNQDGTQDPSGNATGSPGVVPIPELIR